MSRGVTRVVQFLAIVYWWLAVVPAFSVSTVVASIASVLLVCSIGAYFFEIRGFAVLFYTAAVWLPLWNTQGIWLLPAALLGLCFPLLIAFILLEPAQIKPKFGTTEKRVKLPVRVVFFLIIWLSGLLLFALFQSENAPLLILAWSCLMLIGGGREWGLFTNREWHGYMARRDIFLAPGKWKQRFILSGLGVIVVMLLCYGIYKISGRL